MTFSLSIVTDRATIWKNIFFDTPFIIGDPDPMTGLTTHVLDTALGKPAEGLGSIFSRSTASSRKHLKTVETNADGRVDGGPILIGDNFNAGTYELLFHAGDYLRATGAPAAGPGLSRSRADPLRHRRHDSALSRAAADLALRLFHLSRELSLAFCCYCRCAW